MCLCVTFFFCLCVTGQDVVFQCLGESLLDNAFQGYNACIFAYGQTGEFSKYVRVCMWVREWVYWCVWEGSVIPPKRLAKGVTPLWSSHAASVCIGWLPRRHIYPSLPGHVKALADHFLSKSLSVDTHSQIGSMNTTLFLVTFCAPCCSAVCHCQPIKKLLSG